MAHLLVEEFDNIEVLTEQSTSGKKLFLEGKFAAAEQKNGNGRIYPKAVMEQAVDEYVNGWVKPRRALGELNHPKRPYPDPAEGAILIESLEWRGNDVYGKAAVLSTPKGQIVRGLLEGGWNAGVSTRGVGSLVEQGGTKIVQRDFRMFAVDVVDGPSGPGCNPTGIYESMNFVLNEQTGLYMLQEGDQLIDTATHKGTNEIALLDVIEKHLILKDFLKKHK